MLQQVIEDVYSLKLDGKNSITVNLNGIFGNIKELELASNNSNKMNDAVSSMEKFVENVKKLKEYEVESDGKIELTAVSTCFQMSTMYSIIESEEWCNTMGVNFHLRFLEGPLHHSVASLPDSAKLKLIEYYKQYIGKSIKADIIVKHLQNHLGEKYHKPVAVKEFIKFMDYLDTTRNTDWKTVFPEVLNLINESI
jgi:hypothetical protein